MEEDYEDLVDEAEDDLELAQDMQEGQADAYEATYPQAKEKSDIYNWFWKVVRLREPFKLVRASNLSFQEIGEFGVSVRDAMNLANLGGIFHHEKFANYWLSHAGITSATSMAKKGWFMDLSISQKKVRERARSSSSGEQKWRMFNKKNQSGQGDQ